ncbi:MULTISPECIES: DUF6879 family protein [unclassified Streptomyces]|uniref:DUF6879 family protein n=1 Tax=unclassified Streptomyces TaxID=2593676 RepID=UPI001BEBAE43|nr:MULTISPECIES: DUF6879 family protein [unclassified Streptomyces]MBT2404429.1 hypothetical protein [Streptomyces sp. ISL-21]MBT2612517.1 hypothetical protein [Streptomyces sp. ISL-87]
MELISSAQRNRLFETFTEDAFHLELRDDYSVADENGPFESWLRGEPVDYSYMEPWTQLIGRLTREGKTVRRVRVVTEPHTPYIQWEYAATSHNEVAGEDIRWVSRHLLADELVFPVGGNDWWLFDGRLLAVGHFDGDGRVLGSELVETPDVVAECVRVRDLLWALATPHREYKP